MYVPAARLAGVTDTVTVPAVVPDAGVAVSHPLPLVIVTVVVKFTAVAGVADTEMVWFAGVAPPVWYVNESDAGVAEIATGAVTVRVTGIVAVVFVPSNVTVTDPLYEPAASPAPLAVTVIAVGVLPNVGETVSHAAELAAINDAEPTPALTESCCPAGAVPPCSCVKLSDAGVTERAVVDVIVSVTGTISGEGNPELWMVTEPEYVPGASAPGVTDTVTEAGVVPEVGLTNNQPELDGVAVNASGELSVLLSEMLVGASDVVPYAAVRLIPAGVMLSKGVVATVSVTGICAVAPIEAAEILIVPVQVCGVVRPVVLMLTINVVGVDVANDVTCNQFDPHVDVTGVAVMDDVAFGVVIETLCDVIGFVPPIWYPKYSADGDTFKPETTDALLTFKVTWKDCGLFAAPLAVTVTVPV